MSLFVDNFSSGGPRDSQESEQGANAALIELDKGLRSSKIGEQSEAIVRFPRLFEKYPFPILINSALLKLAEVFRQGSNFLKLCVLRVCEESERHLDKVTNVDELVRRVVTVIHSNDPVARALTLRTLGAIAAIIPERVQVHHKVRSSLDSQDFVELEAAMYAATRFASRSKSFSVDMYPKLLEMIQGYATPIQVKLKLIPIFEHMHHDAHTAAQVRSACLSMLPSYPGQDFVIVTLRTLTSLARHTLVDIPDQVNLLLECLIEESGKSQRRSYQAALLSDLLTLTETAHLWTEKNIADLVEFACRKPGKRNLVSALLVLNKIVESGGVHKVDLGQDSLLLELVRTCCYCPQIQVAAMATQLIAQLAAGCAREGIKLEHVDLVNEAVLAIEALCLLLSSGAEDGGDSLRRCLKCVVSLCTTQPEAIGQFVDILGGMLTAGAEDPATAASLCETLAMLASLRPGVLSLLVPDVCHLVGSLAGRKSQARTVVLLDTLLMQTMRGHHWSDDAKQALTSSLSSLDGWSNYRVGRAAARYGHHWIAKDIFRRLQDSVSNETSHYWLSALALFAQAEEALSSLKGQSQLQKKMMTAVTTYQRGISALRAASTPGTALQFQLDYVRCRVELVQALTQLAAAATSLRTSPPPAIAAALAAQSRDDLQRCGRVAGGLRRVVKQLEGCSQQLARLYESSFDADNASLAQLAVLQQGTSGLAQWIEMVCLKSALQGSMFIDTEVEFVPVLPAGMEPAVEIQGLVSTFKDVAGWFRKLAANPDAKPISHLHTDCVFDVVKTLNSSPLPYPRFFFQSLQQTRLKLAVSPQPRAAGEPVPVNTSQYLAVKVEGIVEKSVCEGLEGDRGERQVAAVVVQVQAGGVQQQAGGGGKQHDSKSGGGDGQVSLEQEAEPHNDFFSSQFLVPFPQAGLYSLTVDTLLVDRAGHRWRTGTKTTLTVKSFEDRTNSNRISIR